MKMHANGSSLHVIKAYLHDTPKEILISYPQIFYEESYRKRKTLMKPSATQRL